MNIQTPTPFKSSVLTNSILVEFICKLRSNFNKRDFLKLVHSTYFFGNFSLTYFSLFKIMHLSSFSVFLFFYLYFFFSLSLSLFSLSLCLSLFFLSFYYLLLLLRYFTQTNKKYLKMFFCLKINYRE